MTGLTSTLINIKRTVEAVKPGHTLASIHADEVMAGGSVPARAGLTLVYFSFTVDSWSRRKQRVINAVPEVQKPWIQISNSCQEFCLPDTLYITIKEMTLSWSAFNMEA